MQIIKTSDVEVIRNPSTPIFPDSGGATLQRLVPEELGQAVRVFQVNFSPGVKNKFHIHHHEQIIVVISGKGIISTRTEDHVVEPGTLVYIPEGEAHRHGGSPDSPCSMLSIVPPSSIPVEVVE